MSESQSSVNRRSFLKGAATGGLVLGVAAAIPIKLLSGSDGPGSPEQAAQMPALQLSEPMVAYIRDPARGEVVVMVGTQEIVLQDPSLAARLAEIARTGAI